jgi:cell division septum initiation protein DivIVA
MNILDTLKTKLEQTTKDFFTLSEENKQLKERIEQLEEKNSILTRKTQDLILTINSRLKKGNTH